MKATNFLLIVAVALATALPAAGAGGEDAVVFRLGGFFPQGGGVWDENEIDFTLSISDFDGVTFGLGYVHGVNERVELGVFTEFYEETQRSEYRDFEDSSGFSILHDTTLTLIPITFDLRFLPAGRHRVRPGGRHVTKPVWYLGGGVGANFWEYEEIGDFVDFFAPTLPIFFDRYVDDGIALELHALAGFELPLGSQFNLVIEGRYTWSDDTLSDKYGHLSATRPVDIDRELQMEGTLITAGVAFRF